MNLRCGTPAVAGAILPTPRATGQSRRSGSGATREFPERAPVFIPQIPQPGVVTIPSNSPKALIEVVPKRDALVEGTESVILALLQPPCVLSNAVTPDYYLVGHPGRDIAYIRDNDLPNRPPTVAIVSPPNGAVFCAPVDVRLVAAAGDPDGWVVAVESFDGDTSIGSENFPLSARKHLPAEWLDANASRRITGLPFAGRAPAGFGN